MIDHSGGDHGLRRFRSEAAVRSLVRSRGVGAGMRGARTTSRSEAAGAVRARFGGASVDPLVADLRGAAVDVAFVVGVVVAVVLGVVLAGW